MAQKGVIQLVEVQPNRFEVYASGGMEGKYLGTVWQEGKVWRAGDKTYKARDHAILALARSRNREFKPRLSFHQSRIRTEAQL
jgi:hypothetical protein